MLEDNLRIAGYDSFATNDGNYYFDSVAANKPIDFCERFLTHVKGEAGKPFILSEWQRTVTRLLFGWKHKDTHLRRYRSCDIFVPRKNGKSTFAAFIAIWMLACDGEQGAECYLAATDREQAGIVFATMAGMLRKKKSLASKFKFLDSRTRIIYPQTNSFIAAIASDAAGSHGYNSHLVICDELHAFKGREFYDVLDTSMGSRRQPLMLNISTSGYDKYSIGWIQFDYSCKVRDEHIASPTHLPIIFAADEKDDWNDPQTWAKCNPSLGETPTLEYFTAKYKKALAQPSFENTFKRLHLNIWTEQESRFLQMSAWDKCHAQIDEETLLRLPCYGGLDLSDTLDLSAFSLVWRLDDGSVVTKCFFFLPEESATVHNAKHRIPFHSWAEDPCANLTLTDGLRIDYATVQRTIQELAAKYDVQAIAYDRYNASRLVTDLQDDGLSMVAWGQGFVSMSAPTKDLERLVVEGKLNHLRNPVLTWCASNVAVLTDAAGNIKPSKPPHGTANKVDGIVATVMALGLMNTADPPYNPSVFVGDLL